MSEKVDNDAVDEELLDSKTFHIHRREDVHNEHCGRNSLHEPHEQTWTQYTRNLLFEGSRVRVSYCPGTAVLVSLRR